MLIIIGALSRLVPHPANVTAIGALAVFSGSKYGKIKGLFIVIGSMICGDIVLGLHSVMWATYGSLAISVLIARHILQKQSVVRIAGVTLISSTIFYIITNFAVWVIPGSMYPKTITGLMDSYFMALPFFRNSLVGDFFYTGVLFGSWEIIGIVQKTILRSLRYSK